MSLPETMQAVEISEPGGPEVLTPVSRPVPRPGAGEILIKVAHAGVNRPDALQRAGNYAPPPDASDLPRCYPAAAMPSMRSAPRPTRCPCRRG